MGNVEKVAYKVGKFGDFYVSFDVKEILYLISFQLSFGFVAVSSKGEGFLFTDKRYLNKAKEEVEGFKVFEWKGIDALKSFFEGKILIVDPDRMKLSMFNQLSGQFQIVQVKNFLKEFRMVKSETEIYCIGRAVAVAEQALKDVLHLLKPGITEYQFRKALVERLFYYGSEEAFETIVASGKGSAIPHWKTSQKEIKNGDVVIVDFGAVFNGYVSDITRTFLVGDVPSDMKEIYDVVLEAQLKGIKTIKAGVSCKKVDKIVRDFISERGYGEYFIHGTGHGIGVEVHEYPVLNPRSEDVLSERAVVTVEPGIYLPELGGVRIEDDVMVVDKGVSLVTLEK
ncbi:aminopeptidase P family protein [Desulfurobacterium atlanticum]|uniref:Xaa-Pro aminopeptidase n=1 Tax=Desulfurobacterium atlanticum TaxID=240169 RepID=A0A238Z9M2_9BACT|nr:aminopeptidase P family protein [Desulfurobacterium atlanticum]SNR79792.1 Xaa-Pro aminopeptidase [Desulfurobacterium atlanticum]